MSTDGLSEEDRLKTLRSILDTALDGFWLVDQQGCIIDVNDAACTMLGYSRQEILRLEIRDIEANERPEQIDEHLRKIRENGSDRFESRHRRKDGVLVDVEISVSLLRESGAHSVFIRDVTERNEASRKLALVTFAMNQVTEMAYLVDHRGEFHYVNDETCRVQGLSRDKLLEMRVFDVSTIIRDQDQWVAIWEKIRTQKAMVFDSRHYSFRTGKDFPVEIRATYFEYLDRPFMLALIHDISERKWAEEALRLNGERLKLAADAAGFGVWDLDLINNELVWDDRMFKLYGVPPDSFGAAFETWQRHVHPDDLDRATAEVQQAIQGKKPFDTEFRIVRPDGDIRTIQAVATLIADAQGASVRMIGVNIDVTKRKDAENQIRELAFYDPLTRLPNRRLLADRLNQALAASARNEREGALLFIDLDNFKTVNDTLGHATGDFLLQAVARRLLDSFREADTVARIGGDEFVVVLVDLDGDSNEAAKQAEAIGRKILAVFSEPHRISGKHLFSTPSIGITLFGNQRGNIDELMKQADLAMYQAKAAGRNTLCFFDPALQATTQARAVMETELSRAIQDDQLVLYYQPQVDGEGRLFGAEALVRWRHPVRGLVSPGTFIPLAEETGLIVSLGNWVIETACAQIAQWAGQKDAAHVIVAVNVSARQFGQPNFVDLVLAALDRTGADPQRLKLELTESMLVDNVEEIIAKMMALKSHGVGFSLDDFGTGYSSLTYLKRLPFDQLKIDQSFVRDVLVDPNDVAIARTIVALAQSFQLAVIAEGVETVEHRDVLALLGCYAYQGHFFSPAVPLEAFEQFVRKA